MAAASALDIGLASMSRYETPDVSHGNGLDAGTRLLDASSLEAQHQREMM